MNVNETEAIVARLLSIIKLGEDNNHLVRAEIGIAFSMLEHKFSNNQVSEREIWDMSVDVIKSKTLEELKAVVDKHLTEWKDDKQACLRVVGVAKSKCAKYGWKI